MSLVHILAAGDDVKSRSSAEDARALIPWLIAHYEDNGTIKSLEFTQRKK
jgi:hypothetical protein